MSCFIHTTFNLHWSIYEKIVMILLATFALGTFSSLLTQEDVIIIGKPQKMAQPVEIVPLIVAQADNKKEKPTFILFTTK